MNFIHLPFRFYRTEVPPAIDGKGVWARTVHSSAPARCRSGEAALLQVQRNARRLGRLTEKPSKKGDHDGGAFASVLRTFTLLCRQQAVGRKYSCVARCCISPRKNGRSLDFDKLFVKGQNELALIWCAPEIGVLYAARQCPCKSAIRRHHSRRRKARKLIIGNLGIDSHGVQLFMG